MNKKDRNKEKKFVINGAKAKMGEWSIFFEKKKNSIKENLNN